MEKIFRTRIGGAPASSAGAGLVSGEWRRELPRLSSGVVELREPVAADAAALVTALGVDDLAHVPDLASPTLAGLEAFLADLPQRRASGLAACWALIPAGTDSPVGLVLLRGLDPGFATVEAAAVLATEYRGTGLFAAASSLVLDCLFTSMRVHRLEARVDVRFGRANGALRKAGAAQEGVLRQVLGSDGGRRDHVLWAIVADDWQHRAARGPHRVH